MKPSFEKKKKSLDNYARYSSIAFQMLVIILAGVFGGIKLDDWLDIKFPAFTIILSLLSVTLAIYYVTRDLLGSGKGSSNKKDTRNNDR